MSCWKRMFFCIWKKHSVVSIRSICVITSVSCIFFVCLASVWNISSFGESGIFKSPTIIAWSLVCDLSFSNACLLSGTSPDINHSHTRVETNLQMCFFYILGIDVQNWDITLVDISFDVPEMPLSLLINFGWKFILLDIRTATPACF